MNKSLDSITIIIVIIDYWSEKMKTFERILIKIVIVQFIFLVLSQVVLHKFNVLPELSQLRQYEGVTENNFSQILETFKGK